MVWKIIGIVFLLILIGFTKQVLKGQRIVKDLDFLGEYQQNYVKYCNNFLGKQIQSEEEGKLFIKLISDAPKTQRLLMNSWAVGYRPPGASYYVNNYQVVISIIQALKNPSFMDEEFSMLNNMLIMQYSLYDESLEEAKRDVLNPVILLREGVQFFVTLPISFLYWTGIIQYSTQHKLSNTFIVKFLNFLIIIIGFVSAIVTIVLGWEQFSTYVNKFF